MSYVPIPPMPPGFAEHQDAERFSVHDYDTDHEAFFDTLGEAKQFILEYGDGVDGRVIYDHTRHPHQTLSTDDGGVTWDSVDWDD